MQTEQLLYWSGMTNTGRCTTSGSSEEDNLNKKFYPLLGVDMVCKCPKKIEEGK